MLTHVTRLVMIGLVRLLIGANPRWVDAAPNLSQSIYFTNHTSHLDTWALWVALPAQIRAKTRPVAAKDYWSKGLIKRFIALKILNAVLIDREVSRHADPLAPLIEALDAGDSLIIFPEGTRKAQAEPSDFKGGLYHLAEAFPQVKLIPVYLDTLHRSMPKGSILPVPIICTVRFGAAVSLQQQERKKEFLARARSAVLRLI
ncbi:MAG: lysophospholipid acyltransferase family protein [Methylotenera sp.]|uniref:lysophospholipid acyltransferase family protein n=1 Tax=Methylotenera sp. TaxID=2051956 RepID=UPI0017EE099B|nr:lysophospholipid acyltransferase family protein [Methylotenera sp.]NOU24868.1 1-acyl-sn-glycerol-3-phosphate acyltransferase [Methylotenera sp.]